MHPQFSARWVECKVIRNGNIHFEKSQETKFAKWIAYGVKIWVICGHDFRGLAGKSELHSAYNRLFKDQNASYLLNPETRKLLL
jgi:hypothetical protein